MRDVQQDWRPWNRLVVEIFNPMTESIELETRVFDQPDGLRVGGGFITGKTIGPGACSRWVIPLQQMTTTTASDRIDLSHVEGLFLYGTPNTRRPDFYILSIRLE